LLLGRPAAGTACETLIVYRTARRTWVAIGDPLGEPSAAHELAWQFRELCDDHGVWPAFLGVDAELLCGYVEMELATSGIGEEAIVPLSAEPSRGWAEEAVRAAARSAQKAGCTIEVRRPSPRPGPGASTWAEWLAASPPTSTGSFGGLTGGVSQGYLAATPLAVAVRRGAVVGVAPLWLTENRTEMAADYVRLRPAAPAGCLELMILELLQWGAHHEYQRFNLGMAPSSAMHDADVRPVSAHPAGVAYRHGEHFRDERALRAFKDAFWPEWRPKYLASPGGFALPHILDDVARLIATPAFPEAKPRGRSGTRRGPTS
jgi:phosphatidylglycerol lysyltransferase